MVKPFIYGRTPMPRNDYWTYSRTPAWQVATRGEPISATKRRAKQVDDTVRPNNSKRVTLRTHREGR